MAITIQAEQFYNDLIIEAFNTKNYSESNNKLKSKAMEYNYDLDTMTGMSFQNEDEVIWYLINSMIFKATKSDKLGYVNANVVSFELGPIGKQPLEVVSDIVKWLRACTMTNASIDSSTFVFWYTTPEKKLSEPNTTLKSEVEFNISMNNESNESVYTEYNKDYYDIETVNQKVLTISADIVNQSKTAKNLSDIITVVHGDDNVAKYALEWIKSCGFTEAHILPDPENTGYIGIQLA